MIIRNISLSDKDVSSQGNKKEENKKIKILTKKSFIRTVDKLANC